MIVLDGQIRGDEFAIYNDRSYFVNSITDGVLNTDSLQKFSPVKSISPIKTNSPSRTINRFVSKIKSIDGGFAPSVTAGRIIFDDGAGAAGIAFTVKLCVGDNKSLKMNCITDLNGYYYFNRANFKVIEKFSMIKEMLNYEIIINNRIKTLIPENGIPQTLEDIIIERGEK